MALFPRSSAVITDDYCHAGHLPSINKAEERWQQVATLTPTVRSDVEESRFRPVRATIGGWPACRRRRSTLTDARVAKGNIAFSPPLDFAPLRSTTVLPGRSPTKERTLSVAIAPGNTHRRPSRSIPGLIMTPRYSPTFYYHYYLLWILLRLNHLAIRHGW